MAELKLDAQVRKAAGKEAARKLRTAGSIPGVVYGPGKDSVSVAVNIKEFSRLYSQAGTGKLVNLQLADEGGQVGSKVVLIRDVMVEPIKKDFLHVDFYEVPLDRKLTINVPVALVGEDERENDGGIVNLNVRELEVSCLPDRIPEHIEVDVWGLKVGENIHAGEIELPEGVELVSAHEEVVVSVLAPKAAEEEAEAEEETAEPELVGEEESPDEE